MTKKNKKRITSVGDNLVSGKADDISAFSRENYVSVKSVDLPSGGTSNNFDAQNLIDPKNKRYSTIRKKRKHKKIAITALSCMLALVLLGGGVAFAYLAYLNGNMSKGITDALREALSSNDSPTDPFYMLLLGIDGSLERGGDGYSDDRCDTIILTRVDPKNKKVTLVSLPRDLQITNMGGTTSNPKGYGTQKLNAAHSLSNDGPALVVETVSQIAGVPISHYVEVNFDGFVEAVNAVGGVEVDVARAINDSHTGVPVEAGHQLVNGEQALSLCRSRHTYDDVGDGDALRTANQRQVLSALASKVLKSDIGTIINTINTVVQYVKTDMDTQTIIGIAKSIQDINSDNIYTASMPKTSKYIDGVWYDFVYESEWKTMMERINQGLSPTEKDVIDESTGIVLAKGENSSSGTSADKPSHSTASIAIRNGSGKSGISSSALSKLKEFGYNNIEAGNADSFDYSNTLIIYKNETYKTDCEAIKSKLGCGTVQQNDGSYIMTSDILVIVGADYQQ